MNWQMAGTAFLMSLAVLTAAAVLGLIFVWVETRFGPKGSLLVIALIMLVGLPLFYGFQS